MTKIRLTQPAGGGNTGDELETTPGAAAHLVELGYAVPTLSPGVRPKPGRATQSSASGDRVRQLGS
jgi:hypothetical protein